MRHLGLVLAVGLAATVTAHAAPQRSGQAPPRDTPSDGPAAASGRGSIAGRVVASDSGRPLKRARVNARSRDTRQQVGANTDADGHYELRDLATGRYVVSVSKPGYITLSHGQRRPLQPSTPVHVEDGRTVDDIDFSLPPGGVITGRIADEDGSPLPLTRVIALRYVYQQGQRQLVPAGSDQADDRGVYRIFGLDPGEYYLSATVTQARFAMARGGGRGRFGRFGANSPPEPEDVGYAPTYYPGATALAQAGSVRVGLSTEMDGVDFAVQLVRMARVGGRLFGSDGMPATGAQILLLPADDVGLPGAMLRARTEDDGRFAVDNVPPGRYTVRASAGNGRGGRRQMFGRAQTFASESIAVDGFDIDDLSLVLGPGTTVRGTIEFEATTEPPPDDPGAIRVTATALDTLPMMMAMGSNAATTVAADATFELTSLPSGRRLITASNLPSGWIVDAVYFDGENIIDTAVDFGSLRLADGLRIVLTDRVSELTGVVLDDRGSPITDFTVIAFPVDETRWQPQSRYIRASRPDQNGAYQMRGLPASDYHVGAVEFVEQGQWYDPRFLDALRPAALPLTLDAGEARTLNLTLETGAQ